MNNVKMTFADLKLLEKDLHRELTDAEAAYGYANGWKKLLESMGLDDETYVAYRRLIELLITFCTKSSIEFKKLCAEKDYASAMSLLSSFITQFNEESTPKDFDLSDLDEDEDDEKTRIDYATQLAVVIFSRIPESERFWVTHYIDIDPDIKQVIDYILEFDPENGLDPNEFIGDVLDVVKDAVVEYYAKQLKESGEKLELPEAIIDEVCEYLFNNYNNFVIKINNNSIEVK